MSLPPKQLQKEWYKKLKASGFKDIEHDENNLKEYVSSRALPSRGIDPLKIETKTRYYQLAGHFYHDYAHFTAYEKLLWELHMNGKSYPEIVKIVKRPLTTVYVIINKLAKKMLSTYDVKDEEEDNE